MKLILKGNDARYAVEQSLLAFFPQERPVYDPAAEEENEAVITLSQAAKYTTAVTALRYGGRAEKGILVCTSGEGIMMAANKVPSIRCGIGYDDRVSAKCVEHNNANMISFGQSYMALEDVVRRVDIFLCETFSPNPRHHRRVAEIESEK